MKATWQPFSRYESFHAFSLFSGGLPYLFYDGEVVLGDGGLYKHQEQDEKRKYLRSCLSHSVPFLGKKAIRNRKKLPGLPGIRFNRNKLEVVMWSRMFEEEVFREVSISYDSSLEIGVRDIVSSDFSSDLRSNFFFEKRIPFYIGERKVQCFFSSFVFEVCFSGSGVIEMNVGWADFLGGALVSKEYGEVEGAASFSLGSEALTLKFTGLEAGNVLEKN